MPPTNVGRIETNEIRNEYYHDNRDVHIQQTPAVHSHVAPVAAIGSSAVGHNVVGHTDIGEHQRPGYQKLYSNNYYQPQRELAPVTE